MSYIPPSYREVQVFLHEVTGLPFAALGVLHYSPQGGGYHEGNDLLAQGGRLNTDYSKRESDRDRPGTDGGAGIDIGNFDITIDGRRIRLIQDFNPWLVRQCQNNAPDTLWIREVIYTLDGVNVKRWDRLGIRSTGDSSHRTHTHISGFRDEENTPKLPLFKRFFAEMTGRVPNVADSPEVTRANWRMHALYLGLPTTQGGDQEGETNEVKAQLDRIESALGAPVDVTLSDADRTAIANAVIAGLSADPGFRQMIIDAVNTAEDS